MLYRISHSVAIRLYHFISSLTLFTSFLINEGENQLAASARDEMQTNIQMRKAESDEERSEPELVPTLTNDSPTQDLNQLTREQIRKKVQRKLNKHSAKTNHKKKESKKSSKSKRANFLAIKHDPF